ncbi:MAG: hypothetical protein ACRDZ2_08085 [Ilumatobacteraceae bacterium]
MFSGLAEAIVRTIDDSPALELSGPACSEAVTCTGGERTVELQPTGPTGASFELTPLVDVGELLEVGPLLVELAPTFDYASAALDDEVMAIELRVDFRRLMPAPNGATTPTRTPTTPVTVVGGGFQLLEFPFTGVADNAAQLDALLASSTEPVDTAALPIDWMTEAVVVLTIPTDACPPVLAGLNVNGGRAEPEFVGAGYIACIQPLRSHTVIASVDRSVLSAVDELVLPAEPSYFEDDVVVPVNVTPGDPPRPPAARSQPDFGALAGTVNLPQRGEAVVGALTDGTPVYVVHHTMGR